MALKGKQNIDLEKEGGTGGGGEPFYIIVTKAELDAHIAASTLVPGATYKVNGAAVSLYGGSTLILTALENNKISTLGHGVFYNPKYNHADANTGIWTAGAGYAIGAKVAWGNSIWVNQTGAAGSASNDFNLDGTNWLVSSDVADYNLVSDPIEYDYAHDWIMKRSDNARNSVFASWDSFGGSTSPVKYMQWGNPATPSYIGCSNNTIIDSNVQVINQRGYFTGNVFKDFSTFTGNTIVKNGYVFENVVDQQSNMNNNTLAAGGQLNNNTLNNFCAINGNAINSGFLLNNVLEIQAVINNNTFTGNGQIRQNRVMGVSQINGNTLANYSVIWRNTVGHASYINSNNISGGNATFFAYIYRNEIYEGFMNSNTITGPNAAISHNYLRGGMFTPTGILSQISSCQVTTGATQIKYNTLDRAVIQNVICTNHNFTNGRFENVLYDGEGMVSSGLVDSLEMTSKKFIIPIAVGFAGGAGSGDIGEVTLPAFRIPTGYFIEEVLVDVGAGLTADVGAVLNLGINSDGPDVALNDVNGVVANLNAYGMSRFQMGTTGFIKTTALRRLILSVKNTAITGGVINLVVRLSKLS